MIITVSGLPGSGKTTVAKILHGELNLKYVSPGEIFRNMAKEKGMTLAEFGRYAETHIEIDREIDRKQTELAREGNIILDGRLSGWIVSKEGLPSTRVWLEASIETRAKRIAGRENIPFRQAIAEIQDREACEWERYWALYGIDLNDLSVYTLVIDTELPTAEKVAEEILRAVR